jgi:pseudoazurin
MKKIFQAAAVLIPFLLAAPASAAEVRIETLNKSGDQRFVYTPDLVRIEPGDTVVFVPTDKGHNTVSIDDMVPNGVEPINIGFNKQGAVTFDQPGVYGIKCTPHAGLGMVALIVVGDAAVDDEVHGAAAKLPPKARQRMAALLEQAGG